MSTALVVIVTANFLLGVVATLLWAYLATVPSGRARQELDRREQERRLQRLMHLAIVQMLAEARRAQQQRR